jgi:hypothetical protein
VWLRFEAESWQGEKLPQHFFSRIARFKSITFHAIDADGETRTRRLTQADGEAFPAGPVFQMPLPEITDKTTVVLARIEAPHSVPLLTEARITHDAGKAEWSQIDMMLLAFVAGMLILPLLFDISFFVVLRERFILLHAAMVSAMMARHSSGKSRVRHGSRPSGAVSHTIATRGSERSCTIGRPICRTRSRSRSRFFG